MFDNCIQLLCDKYHCKCEKFVDCADNEKYDFYVGAAFKHYLLCRIYVDDISSDEQFMTTAMHELDKYDINKIDKAWQSFNT